MKNRIELSTIGGYIGVFLVSIFLLQILWFKDLFDHHNFLLYDAEHYHYIKEFGYRIYRIAFFPLMPLLWRITNLNAHGMSILNSIIYFASFFLLIKQLGVKERKEIALYLTIPCFMFFYLPYSESLFFLCSVLILIGLKNAHYRWVYVGLFLSILARPAFTIFIPAFILTEIFANDDKGRYLRLVYYVLIALLGVVVVAVIQYLDTGLWFRFFSIQKEWGNVLRLPSFPLTSWGGGFNVRVDAFTFLFGLLCGCFLLARMLNLRLFRHLQVPAEVFFSLCYLGGITVTVLLFRGGRLFSLNRFVFSTPFVIVVFNYWLKSGMKLTIKQLGIILTLIMLFWSFFGLHKHIIFALKFVPVSLYFTLLFMLKSNNSAMVKYSFVFLIVTNFAFQLTLFVRFLNCYWAG